MSDESIIELVDLGDTILMRYESNHIMDWHYSLSKSLR